MRLKDIKLGSAIADMHDGMGAIKLEYDDDGGALAFTVTSYIKFRVDGAHQILDLTLKLLGVERKSTNKLLYVITDEVSTGFKCMWSYDDRWLGMLEICY